ncbi:hypothetical protein F2Q68_00042242 [Brassica cretica]|uniref:Uncharacterized protein n=1 Tax=Brassica cretica TaxID=69181 RepID=A0A8S9MNE2_BRACR|nr:hypothetical protein F2Q68_00042242 [Brassica cretica]
MARSHFQRSSSQRRLAQRRQAKLSAHRMKTWRKFKPSLLCPVMKQTKSTCYAIAYVRQLEFHFKLNKKMRLDEHLSIQDFINLIPKDFLNHEHLSYVCDNI